MGERFVREYGSLDDFEASIRMDLMVEKWGQSLNGE